MNKIVAAYPDREVPVIVDNFLSTHKPKRDRWLARHPNVQLHYTPTNAFWFKEIEYGSRSLAETERRVLS
jgi:hypothetical protein